MQAIRYSWLIDIFPLLPTANNEEMEDIQRALNQLKAANKADATAESCS